MSSAEKDDVTTRRSLELRQLITVNLSESEIPVWSVPVEWLVEIVISVDPWLWPSSRFCSAESP